MKRAPCSSVGFYETFDLLLSLHKMHAAVDLSDLAGISQAAQAANEIIMGVTVFRENQEFFLGVFFCGNQFSQFFELRFTAIFVYLIG
jgi:glutamine cyclotransferase